MNAALARFEALVRLALLTGTVAGVTYLFLYI